VPFLTRAVQMMMMIHSLTRQIAAVCTSVAAVASLTGTAAATAQFPLRYVRKTPTAAPSPTPTPLLPGTVKVKVVLLRGDERLPGDDSVAWLQDIRATGPTDERVAIAQRDKQFEPRISIVSIGSTVDFPNYDRIFHNVFSRSMPRSFDLGLYRKGKSKSVRFDHPGLVQVFCNIHPHMAAYLMIVDSARYATADDAGVITLQHVPPGRRTVQGWNVRGGMWEHEVLVRSGRSVTVNVELDISSWRELPHLNKYGKEYPPPDDEEFRY
jgi:plastocyanin